jgi:hypothetical protein
MTTTHTNATFRHGKLDKASITEVREIDLNLIKPSPDNDLLYQRYDPTERENQKLVEDIFHNGVRSPLVLSADFYILSGHRRYHSAKRPRLQSVPCIFDDKVIRGDGPRGSHGYLAVLRQHNLQRVKSVSEMLREAVVDTDKATAHRSLIAARREKARELSTVDFVTIEGESKRSRITEVKEGMVRAIQAAVDERKDFWPLSVRSIHYALLNDPPLRNTGNNAKFRKRYANDDVSYDDLYNLCLRLRLAGRLSWNAINDETRPFDLPTLDDSPASYFERELHWFLRGYRRDLMQSHPHHIEIIGEKNTVRPTLKPIADNFGIPLTTARLLVGNTAPGRGNAVP